MNPVVDRVEVGDIDIALPPDSACRRESVVRFETRSPHPLYNCTPRASRQLRQEPYA